MGKNNKKPSLWIRIFSFENTNNEMYSNLVFRDIKFED